MHTVYGRVFAPVGARRTLLRSTREVVILVVSNKECLLPSEEDCCESSSENDCLSIRDDCLSSGWSCLFDSTGPFSLVDRCKCSGLAWRLT